MALSHAEGPPLSNPDVEREAERIAAFAVSQPDRTALILGPTRISYRELETQVVRSMRVFEDCGLKSGDCIAYVGVNNPLFIAVTLACMRGGLVLVPVNWRQKAREIAYLLTDSSARLILACLLYTSDAADDTR
jgi:acyl-CoA synthetase (AMP-forming)/AMP-acid ligase II